MSLVKAKISELAELNANPFKNKKSHKILQYLDTSSVTKGHFDSFQILNTESDVIPSRAQRAVKKGTIVVSTVRPNLEHYGYFDEPADNIIVSSGFVTLDADETVIDSRYLYYLVTNPSTIAYLTTIASTNVSSYPSFNPEDLGNYEIEYETDPIIQKRTASVLSNIDRKIATNNSIIAELEAMTKEIYDYWFVQFDFPDENGKPYKSSGGKMVMNEELGREIPEGWAIGTVKNLGLLKQDNEKPYENPDVIYEHYSIPAFDDDRFPVFEKGNEIASNKYKVEKTDILVSKLNPQFKRIWRPLCLTNNNICSTEFVVIRPINGKERGYLYCLLDSEGFQKHLKQSASSSTGSRSRIQPDVLMSYCDCIGNENIRKLFSEKVTPIQEKIDLIYKENQELTSLRDYLLPLLMNGQITFSDQEGA